MRPCPLVHKRGGSLTTWSFLSPHFRSLTSRSICPAHGPLSLLMFAAACSGPYGLVKRSFVVTTLVLDFSPSLLSSPGGPTPKAAAAAAAALGPKALKPPGPCCPPLPGP
ncbi:hypothetical protein HNY73_014693 [Argiope bruennichi]|uniref:Uncharacterized protein n=1 Tax=Argiope bruennichi TaxID=94029 RepID=A0A8T0EPU0_ARGBR|nr:hypothetical protein HNY73_014693 [Argiope bruennichi]